MKRYRDIKMKIKLFIIVYLIAFRENLLVFVIKKILIKQFVFNLTISRNLSGRM